VAICRRYAIPVYCIATGPFGRREASIKYVDPIPNTSDAAMVSVRQGPESFMPELVKIGEEGDEPMIGLAPIAITRCL